MAFNRTRYTCQHCNHWQRVAKGTSTGHCGRHNDIVLESDACSEWAGVSRQPIEAALERASERPPTKGAGQLTTEEGNDEQPASD
jgi:hypothetical protein